MKQKQDNKIAIVLAALASLLLLFNASPTASWATEAEEIQKIAAQVRPETSAFKVELRTTDGKQSYNIGDEVGFVFKTDKDCYLYLIDVGTSGNVTIIFPNQWHTSNQVQAGTEYRIPPTDSNFTYKVKGPLNSKIEMVRAFATTEPLKALEQAPIDAKGPFKSFKKPRVALKDIAAELKENKSAAVAELKFGVQDSSAGSVQSSQ